MKTIKIAVVAPVFNEEAVIAEFHGRLVRVFDAQPHVLPTFIYVVDRSTDRTLSILEGIAGHDRRVRVISLSSRFGHQASLLAGIEFARDAEAVIMLDSDLQHPPELLPAMLAKFGEGYEVVNMRRLANQDAGLVRQMLGSLFYRLLSTLSNTPADPDSADFRLISGRVARLLSGNFRERNLFLRGLFAWIGFNQYTIEFAAPSRFAGESKYSATRMIKLAIDGLLSSSAKPLYIGMVVGMLSSLLAFSLIAWTVISYFVRASTPSGWTTMMALFLLFGGIQLIAIGVMGLYVGGIYEEVKGRPRYLVDRIIGADTES